MNTFADLTKSAERSRLLELYVCTFGSGTPFRFANSDAIETVAGDDYLPVPGLKRDSVVQGFEKATRDLVVTMPADNAFAEQLLPSPPGVPATIEILQVERDELPAPTLQGVYEGTVANVANSKDGRDLNIHLLSIEANSSQEIPLYLFQGPCNHPLGGPGCDVDLVPQTFSGKVASVMNDTITVSGVSVFSTKFAARGYVKPDGVADFRTIVAQSGDILTLNWPFNVDVTGLDIDCVKGCDRAINGDCLNEYTNTNRYGGWPSTPKINPFQTGLR